MNKWYEYPEWAKELRSYLQDALLNFLSDDGSDDELTDKIERYALNAVCSKYGHLVEDDHCGIPDHRYCCFCGQAMASVPTGHYEGDPVYR